MKTIIAIGGWELKATPLDWYDWAIIVLVAFSIIIVEEIWKGIYRSWFTQSEIIGHILKA